MNRIWQHQKEILSAADKSTTLQTHRPAALRLENKTVPNKNQVRWKCQRKLQQSE